MMLFNLTVYQHTHQQYVAHHTDEPSHDAHCASNNKHSLKYPYRIKSCTAQPQAVFTKRISSGSLQIFIRVARTRNASHAQTLHTLHTYVFVYTNNNIIG